METLEQKSTRKYLEKIQRLERLQKIHNCLSSNWKEFVQRDTRIVAEAIVEGLKDEGFSDIYYDGYGHNVISFIAKGRTWEATIALHSLYGTEKFVCFTGGSPDTFHVLHVRRFKSLFTLSRRIVEIVRKTKEKIR